MMSWSYLAYYLKEWRTKVNMSYEDVSAALNVDSPSCIRDWETGVTTPPLYKLVQLVKVYQIPQQEFIEVLIKFEKQQIYKALAALEN